MNRKSWQAGNDPRPSSLWRWGACTPISLFGNGRWVNVHSGGYCPAAMYCLPAVASPMSGRTRATAIGPKTRIIEAKQRYPCPACATPMHVESGMVTVTEFARAVIPTGRPACLSTRTDRQRPGAARCASDA